MTSFLIAHAMTLAALIVCLLAWAKGGPSEKAGAALIGGLWSLAFLIDQAVGSRAYVIMSIDGLAAVGFLMLALRFSSLWLGVAMVLQAAELFLHAVYLSSDGMDGRTYVERINLLSAALLWLFLGAVLFAWGRRAWRRRAAASAEPRDGLAGEGFDAAPIAVNDGLVRRQP
jgi:hypothetical protein